jgi:hypothetical protein
MHPLKNAIRAQGTKKIVGFAMTIAGLLQVLQVADGRNIEGLFRLKLTYNRKRNPEVILTMLHASVSADLIDVSVKHHHFPVEVFESSQAEVAVGEQSS